MFNKEGYEKLGNNIYVYHDFVPHDVCDSIVSDSMLLDDKDWKQMHFQRYASIKYVSPHLEKISKMVKDILPEGLYVTDGLSVQKMTKNAFTNPHTDDYEFSMAIEGSNKYVDGEEFDLLKLNAFGFIAYLNDFDGGEIEYVNQGIKYKPIKGDLLIHGADEICRHQVNKVLSEIRYTYANSIHRLVKVSKEYIKNRGLNNV